MFLNQVLSHKNPFWMYLLGSFVIIIFTIIGQLPLMFFMTGESIAAAGGDPDSRWIERRSGDPSFTELTRIAKYGGDVPLEVKLVIPGTPEGHLVHAIVGLEGTPFMEYGEVFAEAKGPFVADPFDKKYRRGLNGAGSEGTAPPPG